MIEAIFLYRLRAGHQDIANDSPSILGLTWILYAAKNEPHGIFELKTGRRQFSVSQLIAAITLVAMATAVLTVSLRLRSDNARHESERLELRDENANLSRALSDLKFRTRSNEYSTLILLHIFNNRADFERLHNCMANPKDQKVATFFHPMDEDDNIGHVSVAVTDATSASLEFGASFLIQQEPFKILDFLTGNPSRIPLHRDGNWIVDNRTATGTIRYRIENGEFAR